MVKVEVEVSRERGRGRGRVEVEIEVHVGRGRCRDARLHTTIIYMYMYVPLGIDLGTLKPGLGGEGHEIYPPFSLATSHSEEQPPTTSIYTHIQCYTH